MSADDKWVPTNGNTSAPPTADSRDFSRPSDRLMTLPVSREDDHFPTDAITAAVTERDPLRRRDACARRLREIMNDTNSPYWKGDVVWINAVHILTHNANQE